MKLYTSSLFRLTAVAAVMIAIVNWWPRSTAPGRDGAIAWYHGSMWNRHYYKVTGTDRSKCKFTATISRLPAYCPLESTYPNGNKREITKVMIKGHQDGCDIDRKNVSEGVYYAPDGSEVGRVIDGTGTIKYCRPDGTSEVEYALRSGRVVRVKSWYPNNVLQADCAYSNGLLNGEFVDFHSNGTIRSRSQFLDGHCTEAKWYDQAGNIVNTYPKDKQEPSHAPQPANNSLPNGE